MFIMFAGAHYTIPSTYHILLQGCTRIAIIGVCHINVQAGILYV
jgi:hypothetical protein